MSNEVDRRRFLKYSGAASAAATTLWVAPSVLGTSSAFAAGSCVYSGALVWSNVNGGSGEQPSTNSVVSFTAQVPGSGGGPDIHVVVTVSPVGSPGTGTNGSNGGINATSPFNGYSSFYKVSMTNNVANEGYNVSFAFYSGTTGTTPIDVYNLAFNIIDIDRATGNPGFNDRVWLTDGFSIVSQGSEISGAGTSVNPWIGTATGGVTNDTGTVSVKYAGPVRPPRWRTARSSTSTSTRRSPSPT